MSGHIPTFSPFLASRSVQSVLATNAPGTMPAKKTPLHYSRSAQSYAYFKQVRRQQLAEIPRQQETAAPPPRSFSLPPIGHGQSSISLSNMTDESMIQQSERSIGPLVPYSAVLEAYAIRIQRWYRRCRDRILFKLMKQSLRGAERSITKYVLKHVNPREATLIQDPSTPAIVRLRFWGISFPPQLVYKVYMKQKIVNLHVNDYFGPTSQALKEAMKIMGPRVANEMVYGGKDYLFERRSSDILQKGWRPVYDESLAFRGVNRDEYSIYDATRGIPRAKSAPLTKPPSSANKANRPMNLKPR
eukprot:TRINITY_DN3068_c0_g1_i12.p1 TRINITY_DN3068_c0_g1~~TRINITY_DN3068_c0_g1_i12.p1  ORF type:complete len:302 (+),score=43.91 TRINITY_DN3068_c0_g1_i12:139-1044(+)